MLYLGPEEEFVITKAQTHSPGHGAVYQCSELSVMTISYSGALREKLFNFKCLNELKAYSQSVLGTW